MKKLIAIVMMLLPMLAWGQTRTSTQSISVFGIPLGITAVEFRSKQDAIKNDIPQIVGSKDARLIISMYTGYKDSDIIWHAVLVVESEYVSVSNEVNTITNVLNAKYGKPENSYEINKPCLRWSLKNGCVTAWSENGGKTFYVKFVDYAALRKAQPQLFKNL